MRHFARLLLVCSLVAPIAGAAHADTGSADAPPADAPAADEPRPAPLPVVAPPPPAPAAPLGGLRFDFGGYFRTRAVWIDDAPVARLDADGSLASAAHTGRDDATEASWVFSRLRLEPSLSWGGDPAAGVLPRVALYAQIDVLDNVLWGDNARQAAVPLFAGNPSTTGLGGDERPPVHVRRLWLETALPIGVLRVGRQASQGGLGLLFNDGNGFRNDFGDAEGGSTFDRVLFATRPLTIYNALTRGDRSETPLIFIAGRDWLVQDALGFGSKPASVDTRPAPGPYGFLGERTCGGATDPDGAAPTPKCDDDVRQWITGLIWRDPALRLVADTDELTLGAIYVNRSQDFTYSEMHIIDAFWRVQVGLSETGPSVLTEGEVALIRGETRGLKIIPGGLFDEKTGLADNATEGDITNFAVRLGLTSPAWDALVELGHSSGDAQLIGDPTFEMFPMHADYRVGLLMFPVAVRARTFNTAAGRASDALHSGGGVANATYLVPKARYRLGGVGYQVELVGQAVLAWADTLNGGRVLGFVADYYAPRDADDPFADNDCSAFDPACALGVEVDVAARLEWLPREPVAPGAPIRYMMRWSTEAGVLSAGRALSPRLAEGADVMWTLQSSLTFAW